MGYPETTCQDWVMGSTGGAVACVMSMLIGRAGGGTGLGTDSTVGHVVAQSLPGSCQRVSRCHLVPSRCDGWCDHGWQLWGLAGAGTEVVSGYGVGAAQWSRVTSYGSATGGGTGGAFLGGMPTG